MARLLSRLWRRNHRKSLIVDGRVAFVGGMNGRALAFADEEGP